MSHMKAGRLARKRARSRAVSARTSALLVALGSMASAGGLAGCGATCEELAVKRQTLVEARTRPAPATATAARPVGDQPDARPDARPHARLVIPHARGNALLARALAEVTGGEAGELVVALPSLGSVIPELGDAGLPALQAAVTAVHLDAAPEGHAGFSVDLALRAAGDTLATATVQVAAEPVVRRDGERTILEIAIPADSVRSVAPRVGVAGTRAMTSRLHDRLPEAIRQRISRAALGPLLSRALGRVLVESYGLVHRQVLGRLGEITRLRIQLPDLPIARAVVHTSSRPPALVLDLFTTLPVRGALPAFVPDSSSSMLDATMLGKIRLHLTGDIVTASANWAIDRGLAPARYNRKLDPDPDGDYVPVFEWDLGSSRPLRIHVFRQAAPCGYILLAVRADLALRGDPSDRQIELVVSDRAIEKVEGSRILELGVWLDALWNRTFVKTKKQAAATCMTIGSSALVTRVTDARLADDQLTFGLDMTLEDPGSPSGPGGQGCPGP